MIKNNKLWVEDEKYMMELLMICVMKYNHHVSNTDGFFSNCT